MEHFTSTSNAVAEEVRHRMGAMMMTSGIEMAECEGSVTYKCDASSFDCSDFSCKGKHFDCPQKFKG